MNKTKIALIVSAGLLVASAALGFLNKGKLAAKNDLLLQGQRASASAQSDVMKAKDVAKKADAAKTEAESKRDELQGQLTTATTKVTDLQTQADTATKNLNDEQTKVTDLTKQLADAKAGPTPVPVSPEVVKQLADAKAQLAELQVIKDGLQAKVTAATAQTETLQRKAATRETAEAMNGLRGRILAVDRNWNFVVLDLGGRAGVNSNATMIVQRGGNMVGRLRITSVEPSQSVADILPNSVPAGVSVMPGDTVVFPGS